MKKKKKEWERKEKGKRKEKKRKWKKFIHMRSDFVHWSAIIVFDV